MSVQPRRMRVLAWLARIGVGLFVAGWCLAVMDSVRPRYPQPELGRVYYFWSAGPHYLTRGEYWLRWGLMGAGWILGAASISAANYLRWKGDLARLNRP
jgi:hypothetical protein